MTRGEYRPTQIERTLAVVVATPGGSTSEYAAAMGQTRQGIHHSLHRLVDMQLLTKESVTDGEGYTRTVTLWHPSALACAMVNGTWHPLLTAIRDALDAHGALCALGVWRLVVSSLASDTIRMACRALVVCGEITQRRNAAGIKFCPPRDVVVDDDDEWTPQPFAHPIRARAMAVR